MRPIKFRGHDRRGNVFYGTYNQDMGAIDDWEYAATYAIDADAEQCCGCDCDNSEVYENDILLDEFGKEFTAELRPVAVRKTPSRRFCDDCRRLRNIAVVRRSQKRKRRKANES